MNDFVAITDLHITGHSKVRSGDVLEDIANKLEFVIDYCNSHDAILLMMGDIFDKPSVPDFVKNKIFPIFRKAKHLPIAIAGNHDELYNNPEFSYKTSFQTLVAAGLIRDVSNASIDFGNVVITSCKPIVSYGKPQISLHHGFLNQEDGRNTLYYSDIQTTDPTYVLLGHDHVEYEPLQYTQNIKIFRPGSFLRGIRQDAQYRTPNLLHIRVTDKLQYKVVPIKCRDFNEIFKTKEAKVTKSQKEDSYENIIAQIRQAQQADMTFEQAVAQVADPDVKEFVMNVFEQAKIDNQHKRQNL